jgi:rubrerythrin
LTAPTTRRQALRLAGLGAGAAALPGLLLPAIAQAQSSDDDDLNDFLEPAIELEQAAALAYETAAEAKGLDAELKRTFESFRDQEQAHATALRGALDSLGFDLPDEITDPADSDHLDGIEDLKSANDYLAFLVDLEQEQVRYYASDAPALDSEDLIRTSAEILGCQAQHLVVLREAQGAAPAVAAAIRLGAEAQESQP